LYRKTDELRRLNAELEQRVAERTAALEASTARLRENDERLRIALDTGRLGAWELDLATGDMQSTDTCKSNFGLPAAAELNYTSFFEAIHEGDRQRVRDAAQQAIQQRCDFDAEFRCFWPDGSFHWIIIRGRPVRDDAGTATRMLGVTLDISERRRAEEERVVLLESERAARVEAERAARAKDEFLAMLSHELRTPLNAILGWAQLLRRRPRDAETLAQGLETIERSARAQARLIDDLLDISRVVSGKVRLERRAVELPAVVDAAIETVRLSAEAKGIAVTHSRESAVDPIEGDPQRLQQVLANLLSNAVKFTPRGGRVQVAVQPADSHVEISVSDTGEGIAAEFLPHIFDRFRQADTSSTRKFGGLGLGLSIARHLVEMHGGSISASSTGRGQGASFRVRLPRVAPVDEQRAVTPALATDELSLWGVRALVVDDDGDACEILTRVLSEAGAHLRAVNSAEAALAELERSLAPDYSELPFDVLVSDIGMPGMDGYELIRRVRRLAAGVAGIPAVALTAFARPEDRVQALAAGYQRHLSKPIDPRELLTTIAALVRTTTDAGPAGVSRSAAAEPALSAAGGNGRGSEPRP
ncbi:MAG TPA: ATP-binding protein, partial [Phycisphaerae bacterium]